VRLYPISVKNIWHIDTKESRQFVSIKLFDMLGRQFLQKEGAIQQLDITALPNGMFLEYLETNEGIFIKKVVKE
jgi:hypothetical protein